MSRPASLRALALLRPYYASLLSKPAVASASVLPRLPSVIRGHASPVSPCPSSWAQSSPSLRYHYYSSSSSSSSSSPSSPASDSTSQPVGQVKAKMLIGFTCKVCQTRSHKFMSKASYEKGVVIIRCDGCKNLHLIADHLGWFDSQSPPGTIENIMKAKGETVVRLHTNLEGQLEAAKEHGANVDDFVMPAADNSIADLQTLADQEDGMLEWLPKAVAEADEFIAAAKKNNEL
ncbi:DNL zinc finger-domain-containing protein [Polychytrium aggregatum]|uniref:DNL zinc finger-domain-containing protein n=1 Tax=Polychytrium aggregatum TaxID=110093 RepID=UPI0022FF0BFD|nr:DNL zinc finger-domain-containing protein [Polychytrium aggregatum]KAI9202736.1 DNL zinc finger-domain-containing protein [Polychytrium aggregatum]